MWLNFAAKRIKGKELLIVATNRPAHHALTTYSQCWATECLFAEAKTKGFNLEDTRLSIAKKVSLLIGIVALAMAWAAKMASKNLAPKAPRKITRQVRQVHLPHRPRRNPKALANPSRTSLSALAQSQT